LWAAELEGGAEVPFFFAAVYKFGVMIDKPVLTNFFLQQKEINSQY
jgi:hypothetical protein